MISCETTILRVELGPHGEFRTHRDRLRARDLFHLKHRVKVHSLNGRIRASNE